MRPRVGGDLPPVPVCPDVEAEGDPVLLSDLGELLVYPVAHDLTLPAFIWNEERDDERMTDRYPWLVWQARWVQAIEGTGHETSIHGRPASVSPGQTHLLGCWVRRAPGELPFSPCHDEHFAVGRGRREPAGLFNGLVDFPTVEPGLSGTSTDAVPRCREDCQVGQAC